MTKSNLPKDIEEKVVEAVEFLKTQKKGYEFSVDDLMFKFGVDMDDFETSFRILDYFYALIKENKIKYINLNENQIIGMPWVCVLRLK